jgi:hypothetical protein
VSTSRLTWFAFAPDGTLYADEIPGGWASRDDNSSSPFTDQPLNPETNRSPLASKARLFRRHGP